VHFGFDKDNLSKDGKAALDYSWATRCSQCQGLHHYRRGWQRIRSATRITTTLSPTLSASAELISVIQYLGFAAQTSPAHKIYLIGTGQGQASGIRTRLETAGQRTVAWMFRLIRDQFGRLARRLRTTGDAARDTHYPPSHVRLVREQRNLPGHAASISLPLGAAFFLFWETIRCSIKMTNVCWIALGSLVLRMNYSAFAQAFFWFGMWSGRRAPCRSATILLCNGPSFLLVIYLCLAVPRPWPVSVGRQGSVQESATGLVLTAIREAGSRVPAADTRIDQNPAFRTMPRTIPTVRCQTPINGPDNGRRQFPLGCRSFILTIRIEAAKDIEVGRFSTSNKKNYPLPRLIAIAGGFVL